MTADDLIKRVKIKNKTDEEWLKLHEDICSFLNESPTLEEKQHFVPLGYLEVVSMVCDGILRKRKLL